MEVRDAFPAGAVTGADFVTGRYEMAPGDRVVDLQVDLDALPAWGLLCLHESTVTLMMTALGWEYDPVLAAKVKELARLRKLNKQMRDAMTVLTETLAAVSVSP
jgi:hypothetical protein